MPKSSRLVSVICARSAYLHTGQRPYQAALQGLIHDRTRSRGRTAQNLLARMGASIHGISPGDNFVSTIIKEIRRATEVVAVISDSYAASPWGKAELYSALASRKVA